MSVMIEYESITMNEHHYEGGRVKLALMSVIRGNGPPKERAKQGSKVIVSKVVAMA
jgi:hypothetical protein